MKTFEKNYKNHLSNFRDWEQLKHAEDWLLFPENLGSRLSIDETSLSNGELYTIVTNKDAKGRQGSIVALIKGTKSKDVRDVLDTIPFTERLKVEEVTLDMANNMDWIIRECFKNAGRVTDRFHVQQLISDALQEIRIKLRWKAVEKENEAVAEAKEKRLQCKALEYSNAKLLNTPMVIQRNNSLREADIFSLSQRANGQKVRKRGLLFSLSNSLNLKRDTISL